MKDKFDREAFTAAFNEFFEQHKEQILASAVTMEELAKDPDFIADEDCLAEIFDLSDRS